jgi:hypothetical protein
VPGTGPLWQSHFIPIDTIGLTTDVYDSSLKLSYFNGEGGLNCPDGTDSPQCYFYADGIEYNYYESHFEYDPGNNYYLYKIPAYIIEVK